MGTEPLGSGDDGGDFSFGAVSDYVIDVDLCSFFPLRLGTEPLGSVDSIRRDRRYPLFF